MILLSLTPPTEKSAGFPSGSILSRPEVRRARAAISSLPPEAQDHAIRPSSLAGEEADELDQVDGHRRLQLADGSSITSENGPASSGGGADYESESARVPAAVAAANGSRPLRIVRLLAPEAVQNGTQNVTIGKSRRLSTPKEC